MMKNKLLVTFLFAISLIIVFWVSPINAAAQTGEVKADVSVSAFVPTKACVQYSSFASNVTEILSDNSQKTTLTVVVKDCNQVPVSGVAVVVVTSNRGAIDKINNVDTNGQVLSSGDGFGVAGETDANGYAFFEAYSKVPGQAVFTARVDDQLDVGQIKVTFLPLPFPKNIVVVAEVPKIVSPSGEVTIFKPKNMDVDEDNLVNLTMELRIPSWVFYFVIFIVLVNFLMFSTILALSLKIQKLQKVEIAELAEEKEILEKEEKEIEKIAEKEENKF